MGDGRRPSYPVHGRVYVTTGQNETVLPAWLGGLP